MSQAPNNDGNPPADPKGNDDSQNNDIDLSTLSGDQLEKVLENKELWNLPRIKELREQAAEAKKLKEAQEKADEEKLKEQEKWQELANKKSEEAQSLQEKYQKLQVNQALTAKLVAAGVVHLEDALKLADTSKLEVTESGEVKGVEDVVKELQEGKAYLFNKVNSHVGNPTNPNNSGGQGGPAKFKRSQLQDPKFYQEHREEIIKAMKSGLIEDDITQ